MGLREILEFSKKNGVAQLDLRFSDIPVPQHHVSCPITELSEESFHEGFGIDGSRIPGWAEVEESDILLIPDPATAFLDPFYELPTLVMTCDVIDPITRQNHPRDPRWIARKAELYLKNTGAGDVAHFGVEAEFFIFDRVRFDQDEHSSFHFTDRREDLAGLRTVMVETMIKCGLNVHHHHEIARSGRSEISLCPASVLKAADSVLLYKYIVRNLARRHGKTATFMPKPLFGDRGSGMHTHQSLWKDGEPVLSGDGYGGLSQMGLFYIGGLLKHARALSAIIAPTTNSYKRLVPGDQAPVNLAYSRRIGSAACRIRRSQDTRIEFRPPDSSSNPYLAFAAMLMAGLDGVLNQIDPGEPLDGNIDDFSPEGGKDVPSMPASLEEALDCLEEDHDFLIKSDVFGEDTLEAFIEYKRRNESDAIRLRPHPYEFELYYDV